MLKYFQRIVYLVVLIVTSVYGEIVQAPTLIPIKAAIERANKSTLVIFDVDDVLIMATDQLLQPAQKKYRDKLWKDMTNGMPREKQEEYFSITLLQRKAVLVDPGIVSLIQETQKRNIRTMALTLISSGKLGKIPSLAEWRANELEGLGIRFSDSWPKITSYRFDSLKPVLPGKFAAFHKGILFTSHVPKGPHIPKGVVLERFLKEIIETENSPESKVDTIIFVDDKLSNLKSVEEMCARLGFKYIGFEYTQANSNASKAPFDEKRAHFQENYLLTQGKWLEDQEASKLMM